MATERFSIRDLESWYYKPGKIAPYPEELYLVRWMGKQYWITEPTELEYVLAHAVHVREVA